MGRMGLAFAILRTSYNAICKQNIGPAYELAGMSVVTVGVAYALL